jgi:Bacterial HORMA domain 2
MTTASYVDTSVHSVTYVTEKLLLSIKEIIVKSGLSAAKMTRQWGSLEQGISTWISSKHLRQVYLEIFDPAKQKLVCRWDLDIIYGYGGDGEFWADTDAIKYHIAKAGSIPSKCEYRICVDNAPGASTLDGWTACTLYSTDGFSRYSVGTTIGSGTIGAGLAYWGT